MSTDTKASPDRVLFYAFVALFFWLPLPLGSNRAWAWSLMQVWVAMLGLWWLWLFRAGHVDLTSAFRKAWPVFILFGLWLLLLAAQLLPLPPQLVAWISPRAMQLYREAGVGIASLPLSLEPFLTGDFLLNSLAYITLFALALLLLRRRWRIRLLITVVVLSGLFQALYGGFMVLSGLELGFFFEKDSYRGVATGTFVNRNHLAGYLELCLAAGMGLLLAEMGQGTANNWRQRLRDLVRWMLSPKMRLRIYLAVMVIGLVLTRSRMGNTAFFSSLLVAGGAWLLLSGRRPKGSVMLLLASLLVIDIYIVGAWFGSDKVVRRLEQTSVVSETRDEVVSHGLDYRADYPLVGSGGGTFHAVFPSYRQQDVTHYYDYAHNDYLQMAVETGWLGLALLGSVVVVSLGAALWAIYRRQDGLMRGLGFSSLMGVIALMIHSAVDFNLQIPANATLFVLMLSFAWIGVAHQRGPERSRLTRKSRRSQTDSTLFT